jgi:Carboxypeptidase regulatory-like domain/TonB-dependent Receptor Plug Domain
MNKFLQVLSVLLITSFSAKSQTGEVQGRVTDEKGEPVPFAIVVVIRDQAGKERTSKGTKADANGYYTLKGMNPGTYNLMATSVGKQPAIEIGIRVEAGRPVTVNFTFEQKSNTKKEVVIIDKRKTKPPKMIDVFKPKETVLSSEDVKDASVRDVGTIAASTGGVAQADVGGGLNVGGGRGEGLVYFVDGVKQTGSPNVPANQIEQLEVITSGVPAKYGDANAGVISIITKGPADKLMGSIEGLTSQFLDPYAYKLGNFSLRGPLIRRKSTIDSLNPNNPIKIKGEPILGFALGAEYEYTGDFSPSAVGNWKVKDAKMKQIQENPYRVSTDGTQLLLEQSFLTRDDLEEISAHQNTSGRTIRFNGKLDWKVIPNSTNVTVGFRGEDNEYNSFIARYSLLNYQNNPVYRNKSFNGFVRLYQPLFNSDKQTKKAIRNTTMSLQFDATLSGQDFKSPVGGENPWNYGYIGKFEEIRDWNYSRETGGDGTKVYYAPNQFLTFTDFVSANVSTPNGIKYTPGTVNPLAAAQTNAFINTYNNTIGLGELGPLKSINAIENAGGIINGLRANITVHDLFFPAARIFNGIQKQENMQFRASGAFNFDIQPVNNKSGALNKHTIEAGFEIEQRVNSSYNINPLTLWSTAQSAFLNNHLSADNTKNFNPLMIMRGGSVRMRLQDYMKQDSITFAAFDTLLYDKEVSNGQQTNFSKNIRAELFGGDSLTRINIHELDPNKMKLEWFSADELLNNNLASGAGYDIYGNKLAMSTTFNEFFTAKDKNGNFLRHVAAFMPRYAAGYVQDRFQLKSLALNVGFRVDYFDPNSNTLIDPYVPQGGRTISEVNDLGPHPGNIPGDAVVYVDKAVGPSRITGYRVGSQWYSKNGAELAGPSAIEIETGSNVQPYLKGDANERERRDMSSAKFDPSLMFTKAPAQFAFAPRINFSFQIDTFALLFAHYDVLNQRPEEGASVATALNYYNLLQRRNTSFISNPDLGFSSTSDLELGFKQRLNSRSTLTVNFQYREYSNQVSVTRIAGAYPGAYNTFSNSDFSTVKSIGLSYEQRRVKNLKLKANYTMQFSEGTSSSRTAQLSLINAGLGNLRVIYPLNWDQRHTFNFTANYRFDSRDPYNKGIPSILKDFGANVNFTLYSGRPFTLQQNPTPEAFMNSTARAINLGDINSANMPWVFNSSLKFDKDFNFKFGRVDSSKGPNNRKEIGLNVYLQVTNIFNMQNVLSVYRYTGDPNTDGYLTSGDGILEYTTKEATSKGYGQSFRDLYNIALQIPDGGGSNFVRPRVIQLGAVLSF